jgi:hypothetical protein
MKKLIVFSSIIIVLLCAGCSLFSKSNQQKGWEYDSILLMCSSLPTNINYTIDEFRCTKPGVEGEGTEYSAYKNINSFLNTYGTNGWELIGYNLTGVSQFRTDFLFVFKRPIIVVTVYK